MISCQNHSDESNINNVEHKTINNDHINITRIIIFHVNVPNAARDNEHDYYNSFTLCRGGALSS